MRRVGAVPKRRSLDRKQGREQLPFRKGTASVSSCISLCLFPIRLCTDCCFAHDFTLESRYCSQTVSLSEILPVDLPVRRFLIHLEAQHIYFPADLRHWIERKRATGPWAWSHSGSGQTASLQHCTFVHALLVQVLHRCCRARWVSGSKISGLG